jgi:hypothetical protein
MSTSPGRPRPGAHATTGRHRQANDAWESLDGLSHIHPRRFIVLDNFARNCLRICGARNSRGRCFTSSRHRLGPGLRHATTAHTSEMCKETLASVVLRLSLALPFLVLCFSLPVSSLVLCLHQHHLAPARKSQKRLPFRTIKARTTNELACQSPFAPNAFPGSEAVHGFVG